MDVTVDHLEELRPRRKHEDNSGLRARAADAEKRDSGHPDLELTDLVRERPRNARSRRRGWFRRKA